MLRRLMPTGAAVLVLAGCAHAAPPAPAAAPAPPPAAAPTAPPGTAAAAPRETPAPGGVTTAAQIFGPACADVPSAAVPTTTVPTTTAPHPTAPHPTAPHSREHPSGSHHAEPHPAVPATPTAPPPTPGSPATAVTVPEQPDQRVVEAIAADPRLTTLTTVIKKADLTATLDGAAGLTVFAPTDQAWAALRELLGTAGFNALIADQNKLTELLKYQVLTQRTDRAALLTAGAAETLEGGSVQITLPSSPQPAPPAPGAAPTGAGAAGAASTIRIGDAAGRTATVLCGNIPTANATVFLVDQVLLRRQP